MSDIELGSVSSNPHTALLNALKHDNFKEFKRILEVHTSDSIDINHVYPDSENRTLLEIACSRTDTAAYVHYLLKRHSVDANRIDPFYDVAPIHIAVSHSDYDTVKLLAEHDLIDILQPNGEGKTALNLAAERNRNDLVELLKKQQTLQLERGKIKIFPFEASHSTLENYNSVDKSYIYSSPSHLRDDRLCLLLWQENYEAFEFEANVENVNYKNYNRPTYLQYACEFGLIQFVELLLNLNVNPNETSGRDKRTPIVIAAKQGYHNIVQLLLNTDLITYNLINGMNVLHYLMYGFGDFEEQMIEYMLQHEWSAIKIKPHRYDEKDYVKCLKLILNNVPDGQLGINLLDPRKRTPLYYAIVYDNPEMILSLLERGAYIGAQNQEGEMLIKLMKPATLEYFLNKCMRITIFRRECNKVIISYSLLSCGQQRLYYEQINETKPLVALSQVPDLRPLLKHPVFQVYLDFKWHIIMNKLSCIHLGFYFQFVFILSYYLLAEVPQTSKDNKIASQPNSILWYIVFINNSFMILKEFIQLIIYSTVHKHKYIADFKNWIEITLITIIHLILFSKIQSTPMEAILVAAVIILSYVELMLLTLNHLRMSIHTEMLKAVAMNSFKFLMSYFILILAFAFSFFILFHKLEHESFKNISIPTAVFKTLVMSTGHYEVTDIPANDEYGISHLIFILFIFLIPIVLFNLLNAIAVSDIRGIQKDAELVSIVARVKTIAHMEEIISVLFSFVYFFNALSERPLSCRKRSSILNKQYYYTNYFGAISNLREIVYQVESRECRIIENSHKPVKFFVSASTAESIREKISAKISEGEKIKAQYATDKVTREQCCSLK